MPEEGSPPGWRMGVELFVDADEEPGADEEYTPARGRSWRRTARVAQLGQDALNAAARLVGQQVGAVVREALTGMDRAELPEATAAGLPPASVQLSFGVKLTAGTGKVIEAMVTAGGEASVQVVVTLERPG